MTINLEINNHPDFDGLARIHTACFPQGWSASDIEEMSKVQWTFVITGEGAFGMLRCVAGEAEILTLAVMPQQRRKGIAKAMLHTMNVLAKANKVQTVFLEVCASNKAAIALYETEGFKAVSRRKNYYTQQNGACEDAIVMRCSIK